MGMKILLVNDDGIDSIGIQCLIEALAPRHELFIAAPDRQRSAASKSMTLNTPLRAREVKIDGVAKAYAVDGTPVDCVRLALGNLVPEPDLVISGVNIGPNLGTDTLYSGTCAGAQEASLLGIQAVAVSIDNRTPKYFDSAVLATESMIEVVKRHPLPFGLFYNVNVPDFDAFAIKGWRVTQLGVVRYVKAYEECFDPIGKPYYWAPRSRVPANPDEETDVAWLKKKYITVTPMGYDSARFDAADLSDVFGGRG